MRELTALETAVRAEFLQNLPINVQGLLIYQRYFNILQRDAYAWTLVVETRTRGYAAILELMFPKLIKLLSLITGASASGAVIFCANYGQECLCDSDTCSVKKAKDFATHSLDENLSTSLDAIYREAKERCGIN